MNIDRAKPPKDGGEGDTLLASLAVGSPPSQAASDGPLGDRPGLAREETAGRPVGEILLAKAQELESDLLVMGAHSRTRLREMIPGGVAKYVLEHAQIPVLAFHCGARRGQGLRAHPRR